MAGPSEGYPWGGGGVYGYPDYDRGYDYGDERAWGRNHPRYPCEKVDDRIRYDRAKIAEIDPSRHHKALQWYRDDLRNAERDRNECNEYRRERHDKAEWERREHEREEQLRRARQRQECEKIEGRIRYDRSKITEIDPSRHHKALQWYKDDLRNAERDLDNCHRR